MADRCFGLHAHVLVIVLDVEYGLCGVVDAPDDRRRDLDRVAALVVDLQPLAHQIVRAQSYLLLPVERVGPTQTFGSVGADILAEQQQDRRFVWLQHVQARQYQSADEDRQYTRSETNQSNGPHDEEGPNRQDNNTDGDPQVAAGTAVLHFIGAGHRLHYGLLSK